MCLLTRLFTVALCCGIDGHVKTVLWCYATLGQFTLLCMGNPNADSGSLFVRHVDEPCHVTNEAAMFTPK